MTLKTLLGLFVILTSWMQVGCDHLKSSVFSDESHVSSAIAGLQSLEDTTKALDGSSTRSEYYRMYDEKSTAISSSIQKIKDYELRDQLSNVLHGYKLMAERWDPKDRKEATELALARLITVAGLPMAEEYAWSSPAERLVIMRKRAENIEKNTHAGKERAEENKTKQEKALRDSAQQDEMKMKAAIQQSNERIERMVKEKQEQKAKDKIIDPSK